MRRRKASSTPFQMTSMRRAGDAEVLLEIGRRRRGNGEDPVGAPDRPPQQVAGVGQRQRMGQEAGKEEMDQVVDRDHDARRGAQRQDVVRTVEEVGPRPARCWPIDHCSRNE